MNNQEIAKILYELAAFYEMDDVPFKPRAYEKAAMSVEALDEQAADLYKTGEAAAFLKIPGVGRGIAEHLEELLKTGRLKKYQQFKKKYPVDLTALTRIPEVGPKTVKVLYKKLKIRNLADLERAVKAHKLSKLPGFGQRSEERIAEGLGFAERQLTGRFLLGFIMPTVSELVKTLRNSGLFERLEVGGSYRRMQETVGDIDILGIAKNAKKAMEFFVKLPGVAGVLQKGETKSEVRLENGLQADLRLVGEESWGAALQYFTGDKAHNIKLRKIAIEKGYKLSEYGLFPIQKSKSHPLPTGSRRNVGAGGGGKMGGRKSKTETEEQIYRALGMDWIPPELRTDSGEIEAARRQAQGKSGGLPKLLPYGSVKGDLQVQTNWTDGQNSIEEMAKAAMKLGYQYIAITDHTKTLAMTGGLDEKKLLRQGKEIDKINAKLKAKNAKFRILKGAEVNILKDGSLDIADEVLAKLDVVGVSVHSHFKLGRVEMTRRLVRALSNPHVDIFFHPTTRVIQKRAPIDFDFEEILKVCRKNRVALEVNSYPDRLDIHDTLIRQAVAAGVKLVINTDAHSVKHLGFLYLGEGQARRGWATKKDVLNAGSVAELLGYFSKK